MNYSEALRKAKEVGSSRACEEGLLAQICCVLASMHAINPKLTYEGAKKNRLFASDLLLLSPIELGDLQFEE